MAPPSDPGRVRPAGPAPAALVALEVARAAGALALLPGRALVHALRRESLRARLLADLREPALVDEPPELPRGTLPAGRALRVFVSAAEPSGERHAVRLVAALRARASAVGLPAPELVGLGGPRLERAGVRLVGDPVARAAMGLDVLRSLGFYLRLVRDAARAFRDDGIDLFLPVDSPALHVPLGHVARRLGVPVVHYVTPQYWGWAPWRVGGYRRATDLALTILPFEPAWFARNGVRTAHVGHPQLDALADEPEPPRSEEPLLVLLPGSRASVVRRNLAWMLTAAARLRVRHPELEVAVACAGTALREPVERVLARSGARGWARVEDSHAAEPGAPAGERDGGGLHRLLARARLALSVSGTVLVDLLVRRVPGVVIYRLGSPLGPWLAPRALTVPWFSSVNLLAAREVFPEFCFHGEGPLQEVCEHLSRLHADPARRAEVAAGMEAAAAALGPPGAARRAAGHALATLNGAVRSAPARRADPAAPDAPAEGGSRGTHARAGGPRP